MSRELGSRTGAAALVIAAAAFARADDIAVFNTGVDGAHAVLPAGAPDPHYALIAAPSGSGLTVPRQAFAAAAHPAYVPNDAVGSAGSSWIAPVGSTAVSYAPGTYVYRTTFDLTGLDPATAHVDGIYGSDDIVADVLVNGASTGITGGVFFILVYPIHLSTGFVAGVNTLDFVVVNASPGPHGFRLNVTGHADHLAPTDHVGPAIMGVTDRSFGWTGAPVAFSAASLGITAVDDVDGAVPVTLSPTTAGLGNTLVTASAHDAAGNTTSNTFTVHVLDVTAPVISGPTPAQPTFEWHGAAVALSVAQLGLSATDDVSGSVAVTVTPASVGFGDTLVTARSVDAAANVATKTFTVHVVDVTAPVISGPTPAQPTLAWHGSAVSLTAALLGLSATDDVDGAVAVGVTPTSVGLGDTVVTASAVDAAGNHASRTFTVHVVDVTAPVISGPTPATPTFEWLGSPIAMTAAALGLSATDDVDGSVAVGVTPTSVGLGDTVVTASAVDAAGNAATKSFTVHVADTTAPTIVSLSATPNVLDDRNHKMVDVAVTATVADAGDSAPSVRIVSISSIDAGVTTGPSASSADWTITGNLAAQLRAERSGSGTGRTYVLTIRATDASGNSSTSTVTVSVNHDSSADGASSSASRGRGNGR
jgi:hypothetical protein